MKVLVEDLVHDYGTGAQRRSALTVGRLALESGGHLCLVGRSGSGKTTLLNILCGVLQPSSGRVVLGETELFHLGEAQRDALRARSIGCVFQTFNLLEGLTAIENLTLAQRFAGVAAAPARRRARELLDVLGLGAKASAFPPQLSVGEQQRLAIARAVSKAPGLVLADEPTASLDDDNASAAIELLLESCQRSTLIVVTHDARITRRFSAVTPLSELSSCARVDDATGSTRTP
jgi:putative ABC transport system ATP-binding protein